MKLYKEKPDKPLHADFVDMAWLNYGKSSMMEKSNENQF